MSEQNNDMQLSSLSPEERKQQKRRNISIALALAAFMIIVFLVTVLRLGSSVAERSF
ncbi:hypothetical protein PUV54_07780 [Hyphococcus flavus]|uniref:CoxF protein n=1 Tax=Hyphococcus flavus TaxID=1866326 RepID=A0AAE9ZDZ5_9PROT|nr:hypothetical protein [Hyphococcus flavus]WDI33094.1 hypothetical protein PUV54_07780 [Hyphococcus flavus]